MNDSLSLVFTGDIGFDKYMDGRWEDPELISSDVLGFLHSADHCIANVEGPLVSRAALTSSTDNSAAAGTAQLLHSMDPAAVRVLENMHADIWNLCNNHMMDAGEEGVESTLAEARRVGALTLGAGMNLVEARRPVILPEAGGAGVFSVGYRRGCKPAADDHAGCYMWNEMEQIRESISRIKEKCRWCIMVVHGGEEFTSLPSPYTRDRYLAYLDMGADIIVSHHPHVPMNYERIGQKAIFYSLGNFIFDTDYQRAQYNTELGLLLKLRLTEESWSFEPFGIRINRENEKVVSGKLPDIFENVTADQYELLAPLAAKMFVAATKRQQIYLNPAKFKDADDRVWEEHFSNPKRSGRVPGEGLDFFEILPLAEKADEGEWRKSSLENVKDYILKQM